MSDSQDAFIKEISRKTFDLMWSMSEPEHPASGCFMRVQASQYHLEEQDASALDVMPEYRKLTQDELPSGCKAGETFRTVTIDVPVYLQWLMATFLGRGGQLKRVQLQHVIQAATGAHAREADAVVACAGLGARFLGGVEDTEMYPVRGQTVLIHAPWIKFSFAKDSPDGHWTYMIPRRSGEVILGGTALENEWHPTPQSEITKAIIKRCLEFYPEIAPPGKREEGRVPTVDDITPIIIEEGCGLRPARKSGVRVECDVLQMNWPNQTQRKIPVVYNYGHGGAGYQMSWGSAIRAAQLLHKALSQAGSA